MRLTLSLAALLIIAIPVPTFAQHQHTPESAAVDFGKLPVDPLGPAPCLQTGAIGGPADPCAYTIHVLLPDEVAVRKGGQVTFQIHGGGHGLAIYEVSKETTRESIGPQLCNGLDPATIPVPGVSPGVLHVCNATTPAGVANAAAKHVVTDAKDNVVLVAEPGAATHPNNRVWSEDGRYMSAGAHQFLNGGTIPAGPTSNGQLITYQFLKTGRYLVICMNRSHFLNDWMFGFVDVHE